MDLLAFQGTLKSLLQHHSSKASILPCSAFFIVPLSHPYMTTGKAFFMAELLHPYMTTGKTIALTSWTFVGKVIPLVFNILSWLVIAFLPRISSVQFTSVAQSCPTLCDPMNCSTPGLPVHHQLPEYTQTHVHQVSDPIQASHPLSSPFPPAPNPFQHQSLFQ